MDKVAEQIYNIFTLPSNPLLGLAFWASIFISVGLLIRFYWSKRGTSKNLDRPSKMMEDLIKARLAEGDLERPKIIQKPRKSSLFSYFDKIRQTRMTPRVGGTADWGAELSNNARERQRRLSEK